MEMVKKTIFWISRILFGATFIFSGFVKLIDPLGTVYKVQDYLMAMNLEMLSPLAYIIAWGLFSAEFLCGFLIFFGIRLREATYLGILFMLAMTPLTLWIAIADPVTDCGCFGDALVISNWETFWKNIVLSALIAYMCIFRSLHKPWLKTKTAWTIAALSFVIPCSYATFSLNYLPVIDFRPYNIGADIEQNMQMPEGAVPDRYETIFIYEKEGNEEQFSFANLPDSTWTFVDQQSTLVKKGYTPPIHDFSIVTLEGDDLTYDILDDTAKTYLCIMYDLNLTRTGLIDKVKQTYIQAREEGSRFIALTASDDAKIYDFIEEYNISYPFALTDPIQLKTMIRANPGIVVIQNGVIIDKWNIATSE